MKILVTGAAGFIGSKIAHLLAERGDEVVGIDNINDYYDVRLKYGRLRYLLGVGEGYVTLEWNKQYPSTKYPNLKFFRISIDNKEALDNLFANEKFDKVINLAAQAGVRYSIANPYSYMTSNLVGFLNILEACRFHPVKHLLFASSSSVYGMNTKAPFKETDVVTTLVSLYAASKKSNELMAHAYPKGSDILNIICEDDYFFNSLKLREYNLDTQDQEERRKAKKIRRGDRYCIEGLLQYYA